MLNLPQHYRKVRIYEDVYPGISLVYEGRGGSLKSTYVVAPGADPNAIRWRYRGLKDVRLETDGSLRYSATLTRTVDVTATSDLALVQQSATKPSSHTVTLVEEKPISWQERDSHRVSVDVSYGIDNNGAAYFLLGSYDTSLPLFLDPTLIYTTYIGGVGSDSVGDIAFGPNGDLYITGTTTSNPIISGGGTRASNDGYVARLNATATQVLYTTYIEGSQNDQAFAIAVDQSGTAYIAGRTNSSDLPVTANAYDSVLNGRYDAFFSLITSSGTRSVLSYLGGWDYDEGYDITYSSSNPSSFYVSGSTSSDDFVRAGESGFSTSTICYGSGRNCGFITRFSASGTTVLNNTYVGGSSSLIGTTNVKGIVLDSAGNIYASGYNSQNPIGFFTNTLVANNWQGAYVAKFSPDLLTRVYATVVGIGFFQRYCR